MLRKRIIQVEVKAEPQPEGGFTITCPSLPCLITEGDTLDEAVSNVPDAVIAALELYEDQQVPLPDGIFIEAPDKTVTVQTTTLVPA